MLRFRGQTLDDEALMRFSAHFGELEDRYVDTVDPGGGYISGDFRHRRERGRNRRARRLRIDLTHRHVVQPFSGTAANAYIQGLGPDDSEALRDALWRHAPRPELTWYQAMAGRRPRPVG